MLTPKNLFERRKGRARYAIRKAGKGKLRLSIFRSSKNIYAQVIDDKIGHTIVSASTLDNSLKEIIEIGSGRLAAAEVGKAIASRAKDAGITEVVFDRGGYRYHGRIRALAEAAREEGLNL